MWIGFTPATPDPARIQGGKCSCQAHGPNRAYTSLFFTHSPGSSHCAGHYRAGSHSSGQRGMAFEPARLRVVQNGRSYEMWDLFGEEVRSRQKPPTQETWNKVPPYDAPEVSEAWSEFDVARMTCWRAIDTVREGCRYRVQQGQSRQDCNRCAQRNASAVPGPSPRASLPSCGAVSSHGRRR